MLIWDEKNKEHIVRVGGEKSRVKASDFRSLTANAVDEAAIKAKVDGELDTHHTHIHIFDKPDSLSLTKELNYQLWIGPKGIEPIPFGGCKNWWESPKEVENVKNI